MALQNLLYKIRPKIWAKLQGCCKRRVMLLIYTCYVYIYISNISEIIIGYNGYAEKLSKLTITIDYATVKFIPYFERIKWRSTRAVFPLTLLAEPCRIQGELFLEST